MPFARPTGRRGGSRRGEASKPPERRPFRRSGGFDASPRRLPPRRPVGLANGIGVGQRVALGEWLSVLADHLEPDLARHHPAEALPGLHLDVRRVVPSLLLALQIADVGLRLDDAGPQTPQVAPLLEIGAVSYTHL